MLIAHVMLNYAHGQASSRVTINLPQDCYLPSELDVIVIKTVLINTFNRQEILLYRLIYNHEVMNTTYIDHFISFSRGNQSTLEKVSDCLWLSHIVFSCFLYYLVV